MSTATERQPLTKRQQQVYDFIRAHFAELGYSPSLRDITAMLGASSPSAPTWHLKSLTRKGWIERDEFVYRGIRLTGDPCPHCGGTGRA